MQRIVHFALEQRPLTLRGVIPLIGLKSELIKAELGKGE